MRRICIILYRFSEKSLDKFLGVENLYVFLTLAKTDIFHRNFELVADANYDTTF